MPSKSPAQRRLMRAAAHTPGGYDGVPQSVGKEFTAADKHMGQRKDAGLSHREVAKEFGVSKSTAHRKVSALRKGYNSLGKA